MQFSDSSFMGERILWASPNSRLLIIFHSSHCLVNDIFLTKWRTWTLSPHCSTGVAFLGGSELLSLIETEVCEMPPHFLFSAEQTP